MTATFAPAVRTKPLLRGVSHEVAFYGSLCATVVLVHLARTQRALVAVLVYGASLALLYGVSALYHRPNWGQAARQRMRRLDHAAIFVLIAGSYTPLFLLGPPQAVGAALWTIWIGAAIGVAKSLAWPGAPRAVTAALCVTLGWAVVAPVARLYGMVGPLTVGLLIASGVIYTLGAVVYALKRPDPVPKVFGYHEVFHAMVIAASICHYTHVVRLLEIVG